MSATFALTGVPGFPCCHFRMALGAFNAIFLIEASDNGYYGEDPVYPHEQDSGLITIPSDFEKQVQPSQNELCYPPPYLLTFRTLYLFFRCPIVIKNIASVIPQAFEGS